MTTSEITIIAVNVGNTRTGVAHFTGKELNRANHFANDDLDEIVHFIDEMLADYNDNTQIIAASVNDSVMGHITDLLHAAQPNVDISFIGEELQVPIGSQLDPKAMVGHDRLLNAAAAFDIFQQACVVIDAGTAVTVDFIDGKGTFHGGAIAPGSQMQLDGLHHHTALLPDTIFAAPDNEPFGANTTQAMLHGVYYGIRGMVRHLIERYAEAYQAYPAVIATGGDAHVLFDDDELIEHVDDELTLRGIAVAGRLALEQI